MAKRFKRWILLFVFFIMVLASVLPFISVFVRSLSHPDMFRNGEPGMLYMPFPISFKQYQDVLFFTRETMFYFWNTMILTVPTVLGGMIFAVLSGYGLAKFTFPFKKTVFFTYIMVMLLPIQIQLVGTYLFYDRIGLLGKYIGVIFPGIFSPFGAFLIYQFMKNVPDSILESARLEGASEVVLLTKIVLPQVKSGIASMLILMLIDCWNMVEMPMLLLGDDRKYPLSVMLKSLTPVDSQMINPVFAATIIFTIPILLVFLLAGDSLTEGIEHSNFMD